MNRIAPLCVALLSCAATFWITVNTGPIAHGATSTIGRDTTFVNVIPTKGLNAPEVFPVVFSHGSRNDRKIALTFDACSTKDRGRYDAAITRVLEATHTPATIFAGGKWMEEEKDQIRHLASLPDIEIGNHTYSHPHLTRISDDSVRAEIERTQEILFSLTGRKATLLRAPFGEYDDRVVRLAASCGLTTVEYDLASGDPDRHITQKRLTEYVVHSARNGSIIVMHINGRGWHTAEALPAIIQSLRQSGFTFVTVGQLLKNQHGHDN